MQKQAEKLVISKERVANHGEVYTAAREVNAMLDLVKPETQRIDSRFLEPACGNDNQSRRREQDTDVFRQLYRARGAVEGSISGVNRFTGLGRLRVRGFKAVSNATYLKLAGWNIRRAVCCAKMREIVYKRAQKAFLEVIFGFLSVIIAVIEDSRGLVGSYSVKIRAGGKQSGLKHCF